MDFATLYKQNCAGCHGENGKNGVAISLAESCLSRDSGRSHAASRHSRRRGRHTRCPLSTNPREALLTDQQIDSLVQRNPFSCGAARTSLPPRMRRPMAQVRRRSTQGQKAFSEFCARCHGADGSGSKRRRTTTQVRSSIPRIWRWSAIRVCAARLSPGGRTWACRTGARTHRSRGRAPMTDAGDHRSCRLACVAS